MTTKKTSLIVLVALLVPSVCGMASGALDVVETFEYFTEPSPPAVVKSIGMASGVYVYLRDPVTLTDSILEDFSFAPCEFVTGGFSVDGWANTRNTYTSTQVGRLIGKRYDTNGVGNTPDFYIGVIITSGTSNAGWFNADTATFIANGGYVTTDPTDPAFNDYAVLVNGSWGNRLIGNTYSDGNLYLPELVLGGADYLESITIVPIPEPTTLSVFLLGLGTLISHRWRVRHKDDA